LFSLLAITSLFSESKAQTDAYGYTTVNASMGPSYQNRVFVDLSANQLISKQGNTWDIAFYKSVGQGFGSRINDALSIATYQASIDPTQWDNISIANEANWGSSLYNPDTTSNFESGALEQANLTCSILSTGWGCYNMGNHHIEGKSIYVLKYPNGDYIKFMITDYFGGYTFKYAKWNGTTWGNTITKTIANGTADAYFNYYSLQNDAEVSNQEPPKAEWDFMLTKYWTFYNNMMMYNMSGIIQSPRISVAKTTETQETSSVTLPASTEFKTGITTIGNSWKPVSGLTTNVVYYIKEDNQYYRMYFTENGGATTGNMYFKYKNISSVLSTSDVKSKVSFGMYPNPSPNKQVTLLYDVKQSTNSKGIVTILDQSGKIVYKTEINKNGGFFQKELNLSSLVSGVYLVNLTVDSYTETKKLIIK
ncbi:MAG: T9SS type A sorting domain-containing protein, partial [Chryseobacterium sp.]|nr:T9SS type A sorting domain-containing protein [Candidatus Chryseobacterium enterohippi]